MGIFIKYLTYFTIFIAILESFIRLWGSHYVYLTLFPIAYLFSFQSLVKYAGKGCHYRITVVIVLLMYWIRMVALPIYGIANGAYLASYGKGNISIAIILCVYECIVVTLFLYYMNNKKQKAILETNTRVLVGNRLVYTVFLLIVLFIYANYGRQIHFFEFFVKDIGTEIEREGDIVNSRYLIIRQFISSGILFTFFILIDLFRKHYVFSKRRIYVFLGIILAIMLVGIISGERRTSQVYTAFASCWLLINIFPNYKRRIVLSISSIALFVLVMMTIYKQYNAFLYDTYEEALENKTLAQGFSLGLMDAYYNGINTVSKNLYFGSDENLSITNLLYDFARSIFGLSYLLKDKMMLTVELYNYRIYGGEQTNGFLFSSISYGYIYLGFLLSPLFTIISVWVALFLERKMRVAKSIEMTYILAIVYMRFAFGFLGAFPPLLNMASRYLIINGSIFAIASFPNWVKKHI